MPEELIPVTPEPQTEAEPQTTPEPQTEVDLEAMTEEQLLAFAKDGTAPVPAGTEGDLKAPQPGEEGWIEVPLDETGTSKARFRNLAELTKSFSHAQHLIREQRGT